MPGSEPEERFRGCDPNGLALLIDHVLSPWSCLACRFDWLRQVAPKTYALLADRLEGEAHEFGRGCGLRSYAA